MAWGKASPRSRRAPLPLAGRGWGGGHYRNKSGPLTIEGELVAKSPGTTSPFSIGGRLFNLKFGNGNVAMADANKLTIQFDKVGGGSLGGAGVIRSQ